MNPFELASAIASNTLGAQRNVTDRRAISDILNQAQGYTQPQQYQGAIANILANVSPEGRQGAFSALESSRGLQDQQRQQNLQQQQRQQQKQFFESQNLPPELAYLGEGVQKEVLSSLQPKSPPGGVTAQPIPEDVRFKMRDVVQQNPNATSDELALSFDEAGIPRIHSNTFIENRRRQEESTEKRSGRLEDTIRKETLPIKQEIANKAQSSRESLRNKEELESIIDNGNLDDPTFAAFANALPLNLGQRLLSDETVQYRSALVDEFKDLRNIFKGQTRVAELDILQKKLPDVYLTDSQKKAILKSRAKALSADLIREEAAAEAEEKFPNLGILQFQRKVEELAKPKLNNLFKEILSDHKEIIKEAEEIKKDKLDASNPNDREIITQLIKESNGDKDLARKKARKLGYKF
jgi:hypothetical protein